MEDCKCEKKCFERIPESIRRLINDSYQELSTKNEKFLYLYGLIYKIDDRTDPNRSRSAFKYHVRVNGFNINICQKAFMSIHGITLAKIRTLTKKLNDGVLIPQDMRCENFRRKNKLKERVHLQVKDHIRSLLKDETVIKDLVDGHIPNVSRMWIDYQSTCVNVNSAEYLLGKNQQDSNNETNCNHRKLISRSLYRKLFQEVFSEFVADLRMNNKITEKIKFKL